jgi:CTP:molybdopterin cytidylyltransferase MocA
VRRLLLSLDSIPPSWICDPPGELSCSEISSLSQTDVRLSVASVLPESATRRRLKQFGFNPGDGPLELFASVAEALTSRDYTPGARDVTYVVSARAAELEQVATLSLPDVTTVPIGLASSAVTDGERLERAGAWFLARSANELFELVSAPRRDEAVSVVLVAYDEEETIGLAIADVRRFARVHLGAYEIVVVDDGSRDHTAERARQADEGDVRVLRHPTNRGMGAAMRAGYLAARQAFIVALPGDRQIRAQQLAAMLPHMSPDCCVHGFYRIPHSGPARAVVSSAFRFVLQRVGGLHVDFDGAYLFHRQWLERLDLSRIHARSFVFSFELLEQLRRCGCRFEAIEMRAFSRTVGSSRVARPGRVARVFTEVVRSRLLRAWDASRRAD